MSGLGDMGNLLKQAQEMQRQIDRVRGELRTTSVEGQAGGGACRVVVTGKQRVDRIELDPAVCAGLGASEDSRVQAQRLITEATNDALEKCQNRIRDMIEAEVKRLGLEDLIPAGGDGGAFGPIGKLLG